MNIKQGFYKTKNGAIVEVEPTRSSQLFIVRVDGYRRYYTAEGKYLFSISESDSEKVAVLSSAEQDIAEKYYDKLDIQQRIAEVVEIAKWHMPEIAIPHFLQTLRDRVCYD